MHMQFKHLSECALLVYVDHMINEEAHNRIQSYIATLIEQPFDGLVEIVPSYTNFCVYYNPIMVRKYFHLSSDVSTANYLKNYLEKRFKHHHAIAKSESRLVEIPVLYGGEHGPDLEHVAAVNGLTVEEVIHLHSAKDYLVYMLGFAPGFPFLGGLDPRIATPRHQTPRLAIPAGSIGIAGEQTGIYPLETPGGWQIIGRTTEALVLPDQDPPTLLKAGDRIRFIPVKEQVQ